MDNIFINKDAIARSISNVPPTHYILKIQSFSLLVEKTAEEKYESGEFEAGNNNWKLILYPKGNKSKNVKDHISLYLGISNTSSLSFGWEIYAVIRLFLLDQHNDEFLILQDAVIKERRFHGLKLEWGFDQFIPLKDFNNVSNGYLVNDTCVFGAEVFVKERNVIKGECLSFNNASSISKHVWKINKFSKLDEECQESQIFVAEGNLKWKIDLYPKGYTLTNSDHLSIYLVLADSTIKVYAEFTLRIVNQLRAKPHKEFTTKNWFQDSNSCWGWPRFVALSNLNEPSSGYVVNDVCVVEAEVNVLGTSQAM